MLRRSCLVAAATLSLVGFVGLQSSARAQDEESPGASRGDYAWGEGGGSTGEQAEDPLRIMAYAGAGIGFRLVRNRDSPFDQTFVAPAYFDLGGSIFLPGGDVRHGPSLYVSTTLSTALTKEPVGGGVPAAEQWALTPAYSVLLPLRRIAGMDLDMFQIQGRVGIPIVLSSQLGGGGGVDVTFGVELAVAFHYKFLAGLGLYIEAQADVYGGSRDTVHPILAVDAGLLFDYEVLP